MKKFIVFGVSLFLLVHTVSAFNVSLTNTFGGNQDNVGTSDFLKFDSDGTKQTAVVGDRIQFDLASEKIDGRVRVNIRGDVDFATLLQGYANVRPIKQLNFIAGNAFFWKWASSSAYLAGIDDYLAHGLLLDKNGFGLLADISPSDSGFSLKLSSGLGIDSHADLNFGAEFALNDIFKIAATAQDVLENTRTFASSAELLSLDNFLLNAGYVYNNSDQTYIQNTEHLVQVSAGYAVKDINLSFYATVLSGLNNISFDATTNEFVTKANGVPLTAAVRIYYADLENLKIGTSASYKHVLNETDSSNIFTVYPFVDYDTRFGIFRTGIRTSFDDNGFKSLSIPFSWQYTISLKK